MSKTRLERAYLITVNRPPFAAMILQVAGLPSYRERVKLAALVGLAGAVMIDFGQSVWWHISWAWKLQGAFYDFAIWIVIGLVLAKFVRPEASSA